MQQCLCNILSFYAITYKATINPTTILCVVVNQSKQQTSILATADHSHRIQVELKKLHLKYDFGGLQKCCRQSKVRCRQGTVDGWVVKRHKIQQLLMLVVIVVVIITFRWLPFCLAGRLHLPLVVCFSFSLGCCCCHCVHWERNACYDRQHLSSSGKFSE